MLRIEAHDGHSNGKRVARLRDGDHNIRMRSAREEATALLLAFAERTGLTSSKPQRRYLWTDAFAVCNFLALDRPDLAHQLVDHVHRELGRHRADDARTGWISGLSETDAERHPTINGLRIGKPLHERAPAEPIDERLEWERDGQYFHYLTKWMTALHRLGDERFHDWAIELARVAHHRFVYSHEGATRMYWKMSIDLSRPLVRSMGQHDPLDGFLTYLELDPDALAGPIDDLARMIEPRALATADPLGLGGLLVDAYRLAGLVQRNVSRASETLLDAIVAAAARGLEQYLQQSDLRASADHRLAFRELGLAIGLAAFTNIEREHLAPATKRACARIDRDASLKSVIDGFWLDPAHRRASSWTDHADINDVMLATSLVPSGFLAFPH
jgi:hypothetical protein